MTGAAPVTSSGAKVVQIRLWQVSGDSDAVVEAYGNATTTYYPFGEGGTNLLSL